MVSFLTITALIIYLAVSIYKTVKCKSIGLIIFNSILYIVIGLLIIFGLNVLINICGDHPVIFAIVFFAIIFRFLTEVF